MIDPILVEQRFADHYARVARVNRDAWRQSAPIDVRRPPRTRRRLFSLPGPLVRSPRWRQLRASLLGT